jgi:hypothetical protein
LRTAAKWEVITKPRCYAEARDLAYMAALLRRWHRVLDSCGGNVEQARSAWRLIGYAELEGPAD